MPIGKEQRQDYRYDEQRYEDAGSALCGAWLRCHGSKDPN
jgi:hypothetical protein